VVNPCLSGGALEIYLEPLLPSPRLHIVGSSPTAEAVATLAPPLGFVVDRAAGDGSLDGSLGGSLSGATVVLVSSHGGDEPGAVRRALDAGVGFIGVVCSRTRGRALLDELALPADEAARVHVHVGLDIGARTAPEVALSILAEVVREIRVGGLAGPALDAVTAAAPTTAIDPVCGMTVTIGPDTAHAVVDGIDYWFCMPGCRDTFLADRSS
jgi:xanthine dehydrogenase accessory factor